MCTETGSNSLLAVLHGDGDVSFKASFGDIQYICMSSDKLKYFLDDKILLQYIIMPYPKVSGIEVTQQLSWMSGALHGHGCEHTC